MLSQIRRDLPHTPDEVIEVWLVPHARRAGWPPTEMMASNVRAAAAHLAAIEDRGLQLKRELEADEAAFLRIANETVVVA